MSINLRRMSMGFFSKIKETLVGKSAKQNDKYVDGLDK